MKPSSATLFVNFLSIVTVPYGDLMMRTVALPTSTPRSVVPSISGDSIDVSQRSSLKSERGFESSRKWRAARRQMLRRVFMLLSSPADEDRGRRADQITGKNEKGSRGVDSNNSSSSSQHAPVVAKTAKVRRPSQGGAPSGGGRQRNSQKVSPTAVARSNGVGSKKNKGGADVNIGIC